MVRTLIQVKALSLALISSFFLIKGVVSLSVQDMIELSQTPYGGRYRRKLKNLTQQKANTSVGFVLLLASFVLSLINLLWPMRWVDFEVNGYGIIIAVLFSIVIFAVAYKVSNSLQQHYYQQIEDILIKDEQKQ